MMAASIWKDAKKQYSSFENHRDSIVSAAVVKESLFASIVVMLMGNGLGITVDTQLSLSDNYVGSLLVESNDPQPDWIEIGIINDDYTFNGIKLDRDEVKKYYVGGLEFLYPIHHTDEDTDVTLPSIGYPIETYPYSKLLTKSMWSYRYFPVPTVKSIQQEPLRKRAGPLITLLSEI
jgi:hypothetical protein